MSNVTLGKILKDYRALHWLEQNKLASDINVTAPMISAIEREKLWASKKICRALAKALNMPYEKIYEANLYQRNKLKGIIK